MNDPQSSLKIKKRKLGQMYVTDILYDKQSL